MDETQLQTHFERIGARLKVAKGQRFTINVLEDRHGEFFEIRLPDDEARDFQVVDKRPSWRHLLLHSTALDGGKEKFLCGHDERHWFVAAVPTPGVTSVRTAMEALKPEGVREASGTLRAKERLSRRNKAYIRQGEWFFVPATREPAEPSLRNEPISRGRGSKPHICEELRRQGGETVMVSRSHPNGLGHDAYNKLLRESDSARRMGWTAMTRGAEVYVRGAIRHPDHATVRLEGWHRVHINQEGALDSRSVAFLD